jgi:hypothetical protein
MRFSDKNEIPKFKVLLLSLGFEITKDSSSKNALDENTYDETIYEISCYNSLGGRKCIVEMVKDRKDENYLSIKLNNFYYEIGEIDFKQFKLLLVDILKLEFVKHEFPKDKKNTTHKSSSSILGIFSGSQDHLVEAYDRDIEY